MCAPYFVNLNNNTFQLKRYYSLFIYIHRKKRTELEMRANAQRDGRPMEKGRPLYFFFSSPNLSGRRLDVYHTLTHDVALVQI